jgi:prefoldin subunit 5
MKRVAQHARLQALNDGSAEMDDTVQTARELATHANEIKHLQQDMDKLVEDMDQVKNTLAEIQKTLSEAKGGWRVLMYFGGAGGVIGGTLTWVIDRVLR